MNPDLKLAIDNIAELFVANKRTEVDRAFSKLLDDFNLTRGEVSMVRTEIFKAVDKLGGVQ